MPIYNINFRTTIRETITIEANDYDEAFEMAGDVSAKHYSNDYSDAEISYDVDVSPESDPEQDAIDVKKMIERLMSKKLELVK